MSDVTPAVEADETSQAADDTVDAATEAPTEAPEAAGPVELGDSAPAASPSPGLAFQNVTTDTTICDVGPGGTIVLTDPVLAWQLVCGGGIRAFANGSTTELMDQGDEMILLDFARAGVPFPPKNGA